MNGVSCILLLCLGFCHFLADYTALSTPEMLAAKAKGKPLWPIFNHAYRHAFLMVLVLVLIFGLKGLLPYELFFIQLFSHFIFDTLKGKIAVWYPVTADPSKRPYWAIMGFDQFCHFAVICFMVYYANLVINS